MPTKKFKLRKFLKSNKGGLSTIIAIVVSIIMVLSLISYSVLSQVAGVKATSDKATIEQQKINLMLQNPNIVTGNMAIAYINNALDEYKNLEVFIDGSLVDSSTEDFNIKDNVLYEMTKEYGADRTLKKITFTQYSFGAI